MVASLADRQVSVPEGKDLVLIVGMHRSGTSALGRLFDRLGFYFGDNLLEKIDTINADGFWEDATVVATNEKILQQLGSAWYSFLKLPSQWWKQPDISDHYKSLEGWFSGWFAHRSPVCIKDPRLCRTLPFWLEFFKQKNITPKIVFIYRHPHSVAASLHQRDGLSFNAAVLLWITYTLEALEHLQDAMVGMVCYETLLQRPADVTTILLSSIFKNINGLPRQGYTRKANTAINPEKNNNPAIKNALSESAGGYGQLAEDLYQSLTTASPAQFAEIAAQCRKRFESLVHKEKISLESFQKEVNSLLQANRKLSELGDAHTFALKTISDKDRIYEASLAYAEKRIAGNKIYIKKCHARIREQDSLLKAFGKKAELVEHLEKCVKDREQKISENTAYIKKCEERIRQQDEIIYELKKSSLIWQFYYGMKAIMKKLKA